MNFRQRVDLTWEIDKAMHSITWPIGAQEPDYVAQLVTGLTVSISRALQRVSPNGFFKVGGAFIHQKPLAEFLDITGYKKPELGDLLVVCRERRSFGFVYNALLLQAKSVSNPFQVSIPMDHQFILYSQWPRFKYCRAGKLNGVIRDITPKTISQGAEYLLIDKNAPADMFTATVDRPLKASSRFPFTLASVLSFDEGRAFTVTEPMDMWSQMIVDLMNLSAVSSFNRRKKGYHDAPRWSGDDVFNLIVEANNDFVPPKEESASMGIICIDMTENLE